MNAPRVFDQQGHERDWDWLTATLGDVRLEPAQVDSDETLAYRIVEVRAVEGPAALVVRVTDAQAKPLPDIKVVRFWPDAPELPSWPVSISAWEERGVFGPTNARGEIGFGLGGGDYYTLPHGGASAIWIADEAGPSDLIRGLGMVGQTEHLHLDLVFRLKKGVPVVPQEEEPADEQPPSPEESADPDGNPHLDPPPPPAPDLREDQWSALISKLDLIIELLEERVEE